MSGVTKLVPAVIALIAEDAVELQEGARRTHGPVKSPGLAPAITSIVPEGAIGRHEQLQCLLVCGGSGRKPMCSRISMPPDGRSLARKSACLRLRSSVGCGAEHGHEIAKTLLDLPAVGCEVERIDCCMP